jgi:pimeloyl-ACP methyl ester carboxylesterase
MKAPADKFTALSIVIPAVLIGAVLLAACAPKAEPIMVVPEGAKAGTMTGLAACDYEASGVKYQADCGTLAVPENRGNPQSRLIAVPVIRVRALNNSHPEPIFFLQGGPGGPNVKFQYLDGLVQEYDVVQVGYRGVDGSVSLDCPEIGAAIQSAPGDLLGDAGLDSYTKAGAACASRLESEGVDLAGYTMTEVIDDLEAARQALGYDRINLLGESYGTRLEIIYQSMYPENLNRVVMVAVNPPGHFVWNAKAVDAQLEDYAKLCAQDAKCSARTDDLIASMRHVSENMPKRWLFFPIDAGAVKLVSFVMFMETIEPPGVPVPLSGPDAIDMWLAAEKGDFSGMALLTMSRNAFLPDLFVYGDLLAKGGSGGDFEGFADDSRAVLDPPGAILGAQFSLFHWSMARGWPVHLVSQRYLQMRPTDIETLLVSGSVDFSTPPQYATYELLSFLNRGQQVILKDFGHTETFWNSQAEARTRLLTTFFSAGKVDDSLYTTQPVNFDVGLGWPALAKMAAGIALAVIVLLLVLVWFIFRRIFRRKAAPAPQPQGDLAWG